MAKPDIRVGSGVKVYQGPTYGRQDAYVEKINLDGTIDAKVVKGGLVLTGLIYKNDLDPAVSDPPDYWVELPEGYALGSEGF